VVGIDNTKPIIKMGMPVVTRPITTTVIISAGRKAQLILMVLRMMLRRIRQQKPKPTEMGKNDQVISEEPRTQMA